MPNRTHHPLANLDGTTSHAPESPRDALVASILGDDFYCHFEQAYRDGDAKESWQFYADQVLPKQGLLIDIGCGRGDFLNFLSTRSPQLQLFGVEPHAPSFHRCHTTHAAACMDGEGFCEALKKQGHKADAITLLHVIEHMTFNDTVILLSKIKEILKPSGTLILEFPNTWSLVTSALNFWQDPTHLRPVSIFGLKLALEKCGFTNIHSHEFSPHIGHSWKDTLKHFGMTRRLKKTIFGYQDFCFVAQG